MYILDNIQLSTRNFKKRKLRTALTILGISVGIGAILFLVSLGYGLQEILLKNIANSDTLLTLDVSSPNPKVIKINSDVVRDTRQLQNIELVSPQREVLSQCRLQDVSSNVALRAVDHEHFRLADVDIVEGEVFVGEKENKIIVSSGMLQSFGVEDVSEALKKEVKIKLIVPQNKDRKEDNSGEGESELLTDKETIELKENFVISGIVDSEGESFGYIPIEWTSEVGMVNFESMKIKVGQQEDLDAARNELIKKGFIVSALSDTVEQAGKIFKVVQIVLAMFGIVALIVSAIGMFNTMTIALLERTNEIGIMKALGASNKEIRHLFLTESVIIGFLGGVGGVIIGFVISGGVNLLFSALARRFGGQQVDIFYTPIWFVIFIISFSSIVGLITGVYPSRRAAKLNALDALRYK